MFQVLFSREIVQIHFLKPNITFIVDHCLLMAFLTTDDTADSDIAVTVWTYNEISRHFAFDYNVIWFFFPLQMKTLT